MKAGDHLISDRGFYTHHGLYLGRKKVIHYAGLSSSIDKGIIEITSIDDFSQGSGVSVIEHKKRKFDYAESVRRAKSRLNEDEYSVLLNNCEHFVNWCILGRHKSAQVTKAVTTTLGGSSVVAGAARYAAARSLGSSAASLAVRAGVSAASGIGAGSMGIAGVVSAGLVGVSASSVVVPALVAGAVYVGITTLWDALFD